MSTHITWEERKATTGQWLLGLGLTVLGGLAWFIAGFGIGGGGIVAVLVAIVPALMCLAAAWLLGSWWGFIASAAVYVAASAGMWILAAVGEGAAGIAFLSAEFALYVVLPAVVLAAIGTAIGMYRGRREA